MVETTRSISYERKRPMFRINMLVWYLLDIIEALLGLRFLLRFFGANSVNQFYIWVRSVSGVFADPFANLFRNIVVGGFVIETSTLFAMFIYVVLANIISDVLLAVLPERREEVIHRVDDRG